MKSVETFFVAAGFRGCCIVQQLVARRAVKRAVEAGSSSPTPALYNYCAPVPNQFLRLCGFKRSSTMHKHSQMLKILCLFAWREIGY